MKVLAALVAPTVRIQELTSPIVWFLVPFRTMGICNHNPIISVAKRSNLTILISIPS
tara:strand:+ start:105 stop:275 length:171 start_codon:yes stop_codon:yes gene_type:complete